MRFLFYSHDGLGLGHTRRHIAVATALGDLAPEVSILLATGADDVARLGLPPHVEVLKLPSLRKVAKAAYASRHLKMPAHEVRALRSALLLSTVKHFRPDVVLVDKHPFGASGEFKSGLKALRRQGGRAALGLRDILDEPAQVLREWRPYGMQRRVSRYYDQILVYGEREVFDPITAYQFPRALLDRTRFCGYVVCQEPDESVLDFNWPFPPREHRTMPVVLATAGGGEDGFRLLDEFIRACDGAPWLGVVVAGPMAPPTELAALQDLASAHGVTFRHFIAHLSACFAAVDALVCMGGYNTLTEAVSAGVPTVCVPRVTPRTEQLLRAEAFERLGLVRTLTPDQLTPAALRAEIAAAIATPREGLAARARAALKFDGARRAAKHLLSLAAEVTADRVLETSLTTS